MEFNGRISFLKAAIRTADALTTVSPTYAREILTTECGCALDGLLRERAGDITGILNGADYGLWDPSIDPYIRDNYGARLAAPKQTCKRAIQSELGLSDEARTPLLAFMSRLVHQKMPDVILEALPALLASGVQFALIAEGERLYHQAFRELEARYPGRVSIRLCYEESLAHRLIAGADMLLHPSRFEPCGLLPIYAMRYGTIPIVRRSGGIKDTITDASPESLSSATATGFLFEAATAAELIACTQRAVALYRQPIAWRKLQLEAMLQDFSWRKSAECYADLYGSISHKAGFRRLVQREAIESRIA